MCSEGVNTSVCKGHGTMACGVHSDRDEGRGGGGGGQHQGVNTAVSVRGKSASEGVKHLAWGKGRAVRVRDNQCVCVWVGGTKLWLDKSRGQ